MKAQRKRLRLLCSYRTLKECLALQVASRDRSIMFKLKVIIVRTVHNGQLMPTTTSQTHYAQHRSTLITKRLIQGQARNQPTTMSLIIQVLQAFIRAVTVVKSTVLILALYCAEVAISLIQTAIRIIII